MNKPSDIERLKAISFHEGQAYGRLHLLFKQEEQHSQEILRYKGYLALSDSFKALFLESVELFNTQCRPKVKTPLSEHYLMFMPRVANAFMLLCGAERTAIRGYPYQGYTILRNVFDDAVLTSAALQHLTTFYSIEGLDLGKPFDITEVKKLRKATEREVRKRMTGSESGLRPKTIDEFVQWDALFDYETHGARLSLALAKGWLHGTEPLGFLPKFSEGTFAIFMNRFSEIAWMVHRLLPAVQPPAAPLPTVWGDKWRVVDECFEKMVHSLSKEQGKYIGEAIVEFVHAKFPFNERSTFPL